MRLMSYNILCGGIDRALGTSRLDEILRLVKIMQPDILALQEANGFHRDGLMAKVSGEIQLPHTALSIGSLYQDGDLYHTALFSRCPLLNAHMFPDGDFQSAALSVETDTPLGRVSLCNLHLHAYCEDERLRELGQILEHQNSFDRQIIIGDFNALSRLDKDIYPDDPKFELRFDVTDRLTGDFVDLIHQSIGESRCTYPTDIPADCDELTPARIDYVFASSKIAQRVKSAGVIDHPIASKASDHFPLLVEFENDMIPESPS